MKLSLILDCLPKLSVQKILKDLNESEKEVNIIDDSILFGKFDILVTDAERKSQKDDKKLGQQKKLNLLISNILDKDNSYFDFNLDN